MTLSAARSSAPGLAPGLAAAGQPAAEVTLYELVTRCELAADALPISPTTFKSLVGGWLDTLSEQQVPAWIWAKLPKGESWQSELEQCVANTHALRGMYILKSGAEEVEGEDRDPILPLRDSSSRTVTLNLPAETALKGEFFVVVWSSTFCGVLVAQRGVAKRPSMTILEIADGATEEVGEKKILMTACVFQPQVVKQVLQNLLGVVQSAEVIEGSRSLADIGQTWEQLLQQPQADSPVAGLMGALFSKQVQRQEELWQRATAHRKQAELVNLLQLQNEELVATVRSKDDFLNTIGQELRTPLTNMKTALTLLNSPNLKPPQRQRYMELLTKECDRQTSLIGSLLDLVSLDQMAERKILEPLRLSDIVPGVVSTYQPLAEEKGIRLAYTIPEDLPPVANLGPWLRQIVVNLLHNGVKFTPRGGQVWVRAKQQGDYLQLEFKDTGIGISVQEIPKIFDRFYRVRQAEDTGGAGLGLTIVQQLLLRCGGSIQVKSRPGEGSIFNVLLPIYQESTATMK
jgi:two-component system, OmpR family, phosphate regulon sensor histidine kinase PhoR